MQSFELSTGSLQFESMGKGRIIHLLKPEMGHAEEFTEIVRGSAMLAPNVLSTVDS